MCIWAIYIALCDVESSVAELAIQSSEARREVDSLGFRPALAASVALPELQRQAKGPSCKLRPLRKAENPSRHSQKQSKTIQKDAETLDFHLFSPDLHSSAT